MVNGTVEKDIKVEANSDKEIKVMEIDELEKLRHRVASLNDYLIDLEEDYYLNKTDVCIELKKLKQRIEEEGKLIDRFSNRCFYTFGGLSIVTLCILIGILLGE